MTKLNFVPRTSKWVDCVSFIVNNGKGAPLKLDLPSIELSSTIEIDHMVYTKVTEWIKIAERAISRLCSEPSVEVFYTGHLNESHIIKKAVPSPKKKNISTGGNKS